MRNDGGFDRHKSGPLYSSCSKVARCSTEEPTVRGEESTKSFVPSCKITISGPNSLMTLKSYFKTLAIVQPRTPCHLQMKSVVVMPNFLVYWWYLEWTTRSWRQRIKEWPKIRTHAFPIAKIKRQNLNPTQQVNKRTKKGKRELLYLPKKPESSVKLVLPLNGKEAKINSAHNLSNISAPAHYHLIGGSWVICHSCST